MIGLGGGLWASRRERSEDGWRAATLILSVITTIDLTTISSSTISPSLSLPRIELRLHPAGSRIEEESAHTHEQTADANPANEKAIPDPAVALKVLRRHDGSERRLAGTQDHVGQTAPGHRLLAAALCRVGVAQRKGHRERGNETAEPVRG